MRGQEGRPVDGERRTENKGEGEGGGADSERKSQLCSCM